MPGSALALAAALLLTATPPACVAGSARLLVRSEPLPFTGMAVRIQAPAALAGLPEEVLRCAAATLLCQNADLRLERANGAETSLVASDHTRLTVSASATECFVSLVAPPRRALATLATVLRALGAPALPNERVLLVHRDLWQRSLLDPRKHARAALEAAASSPQAPATSSRSFPAPRSPEWPTIFESLSTASSRTVAVVGPHTTDDVARVLEPLLLPTALPNDSPPEPGGREPHQRSLVAIAENSPVAWIVLALPAAKPEESAVTLVAQELLSTPSPLALASLPVFVPVMPGLLQGGLLGDRVTVEASLLSGRVTLVVTSWTPLHVFADTGQSLADALAALGDCPPESLQAARSRALLHLATLAEDPMQIALRLAQGWPPFATGEDLDLAAQALQAVTSDSLAAWGRDAPAGQRLVVLLPPPGGPRAHPISETLDEQTQVLPARRIGP